MPSGIPNVAVSIVLELDESTVGTSARGKNQILHPANSISANDVHDKWTKIGLLTKYPTQHTPSRTHHPSSRERCSIRLRPRVRGDTAFVIIIQIRAIRGVD